MKEEIKKEEEEETLLYDELYQNENKILANKIDLNIYNNNTKKSENYKLLNDIVMYIYRQEKVLYKS